MPKTFDPACAEERERRRRTRDQRRNYFRRLPIDLAAPVAAACHWLVPWEARHYPGLGRGLRQLVNIPPRHLLTSGRQSLFKIGLQARCLRIHVGNSHPSTPTCVETFGNHTSSDVLVTAVRAADIRRRLE